MAVAVAVVHHARSGYCRMLLLLFVLVWAVLTIVVCFGAYEKQFKYKHELDRKIDRNWTCNGCVSGFSLAVNGRQK